MQKLKKFGMIGAVAAGVLCMTPLLAVAFGLFGLSWISGYLDYFLIPILFVFVVITIYAYFQGRSKLGTH